MRAQKRGATGRMLVRSTGGPVRNFHGTTRKTVKGSFQPLGFVVILFLFSVGGGYLYSVNQNAVQGFKMRTLEKEISYLKDQNAQLQIDEADKRSLARIEEVVTNTDMQKVSEVIVINEDGPIALR